MKTFMILLKMLVIYISTKVFIMSFLWLFDIHGFWAISIDYLLLAVLNTSFLYLWVIKSLMQEKLLGKLQANILQLLESIPEAVVISQNDNPILFVNDQAEKLFGYRKKDLLGQSIDILVPEWFRVDYVRHMKQYILNPRPFTLGKRHELYGRRKDGVVFPIEIMLGPLKMDEGVMIMSIIQDISKQKQTEEEFRLFRALLDQSSDAIEILDPETGQFLGGNETAWRDIGYSREEFLSLSVFDIDPLVNQATFINHVEKLQKSKFLTWRSHHRRKNGSTFPVECNIKYVMLDKNYLIVVVRDITKLKQAEEMIMHKATYDGLTDLPNRSMLQNLLQKNILQAQCEKKSLAILLMDIDRFKEINNTVGPQHGDLLLQQIGPRLKNVLHENDILFRIGGQDFAVLLLRIKRSQHVNNVAEKIIKALESPFIIENIPIDVEVNIGIAVYPDHGTTTDLLMQRANIALNANKQSGDYIIYDAQYDQFNPNNLALMGELRYAIGRNELILYYQPKINIKTGHLIGLEALLRWKNPTRGLILPDQFIGLTERTALLRPLMLWVFHTALDQCLLWQQKGVNISVAINLSVRNLYDNKFMEQLTELIRHHVGLHAKLELELEITESAIMDNPVRVIDLITPLKELGVQFAIDDFGTGYSSLTYLQKLPVNSLKIDKSFVINMLKNKADYVIVRSTIDLAHHMGLTVVAEGVENKDILEQLAIFGCDVAQGYYIGKPMPAEELLLWLYELR